MTLNNKFTLTMSDLIEISEDILNGLESCLSLKFSFAIDQKVDFILRVSGGLESPMLTLSNSSHKCN